MADVAFYLTVGAPDWMRWIFALIVGYLVVTSLFYLASQPRLQKHLSNSLKAPWDSIAFAFALVAEFALAVVVSVLLESDIPYLT